ncbi:MAG: 5' nucleotidase, NT5C type [Desulfobacteraceae bacterium]
MTLVKRPTAASLELISPDKVAFDIDGVVADIMTTFINLGRERYGLDHLRYEDITDFYLHRCLKMDQAIIMEILEMLIDRPHELEIEPLPHAVPVLTKLAQEAPLLFITARDRTEPIQMWLCRTLSQVPPTAMRIIATGDPDTKLEYLHDHGIEYFVEDRLDTCWQLSQNGVTPIVYDQPWNRQTHPFRIVYDWQDIARLLFKDFPFEISQGANNHDDIMK